MSDETNHIKVCGQLCELYNKEWADAFKELTKTKPEKEAIEMLLELMMVRDNRLSPRNCLVKYHSYVY